MRCDRNGRNGDRGPNRPGCISRWRRWRTSCCPLMSRSALRARRRGPCAGWWVTPWRWPEGCSPSADWSAPRRRYAWATTSVSDIKRVRQALGGTFNDVVLASITNGFRELLLARDEDVERVVRTLVPVSVRPRDSSGKAVGDGTYENRVSAMFAELPVDIDDPALRLHVITEQMKDLKDSSQALAGEALTSMSGFAPPMLLALGMRLATRAGQRNVNTVTTNVPGPQFPLYAAGRRMIRAFPYVPLGGQMRLGIAIFSYDGEVNFGITGDYDSTPDIDILAGGIEDGMTQMLKVCEQPGR